MVEVAILMDVDGTIANSGQPVDSSVAANLRAISGLKGIELWAVSGSEHSKMEKQLTGSNLGLTGYFSCNGTMLTTRGMPHHKMFETTIHDYPKRVNILTDILEKYAATSAASEDIQALSRMSGGIPDIIQGRATSIHFSVTGHTWKEHDRARQIYKRKVDLREREYACAFIESIFPGMLDARIGGETGIDITLQGQNKGSAVKYLKDMGKRVIFMGDMTGIYGNDSDAKKSADMTLDANPNNLLQNIHALRELINMEVLHQKR